MIRAHKFFQVSQAELSELKNVEKFAQHTKLYNSTNSKLKYKSSLVVAVVHQVYYMFKTKVVIKLHCVVFLFVSWFLKSGVTKPILSTT